MITRLLQGDAAPLLGSHVALSGINDASARVVSKVSLVVHFACALTSVAIPSCATADYVLGQERRGGARLGRFVIIV